MIDFAQYPQSKPAFPDHLQVYAGDGQTHAQAIESALKIKTHRECSAVITSKSTVSLVIDEYEQEYYLVKSGRYDCALSSEPAATMRFFHLHKGQ